MRSGPGAARRATPPEKSGRAGSTARVARGASALSASSVRARHGRPRDRGGRRQAPRCPRGKMASVEAGVAEEKTPAEATGLMAKLALLEPGTRGELEHVLFVAAGARIAQFLLSLTSVAVVSSYFSSTIARGGAALLYWGLTTGVLAFLFSMGAGVLGFAMLSGAPMPESRVRLVARTSLLGDGLVSYLVASGGSTLAGFSSSICSSPEPCARVSLAAVTLVLLCVSFIYTTWLSLLVWRAHELLRH